MQFLDEIVSIAMCNNRWDQRRDRMNRWLIEVRKNEKIENTEENSCTRNFSGARNLWLAAPYGTCNLLNCIGEEKWSSVTNGRTLILIVSYKIYLSDMRRACFSFETPLLPERGIIVGVQFVIQSISVWFKCK